MLVEMFRVDALRLTRKVFVLCFAAEIVLDKVSEKEYTKPSRLNIAGGGGGGQGECAGR